MIVPKVSQVLFFQITSEEGELALVEYKSRVADEDEQCLCIEFPLNTSSGKIKRLKIGDTLAAHFITPTGVKHFFDTEVMGYTDGEIPLIKIIRPHEEDMTKIQRRNFFRIMIEVDIAVKTEDGHKYVFKTDDISGGGISFIIDKHEHFNVGQLLHCWVTLPYRNGNIEHASLIGEVLRIKELETGRKLVMMKFVEIAEQERQRIIRFLFAKQIELRDK